MKRGGNSNLEYEIPVKDAENRLKQLIIHIATACAEDPTFGATKLNKILFFADFISYAERGEPITGMRYQRLPWGPALEQMLPVQKKMERDRQIAISNVPIGNFAQHRVVPLARADLSKISSEDIAIISRVIGVLWGVTATQTSNLSHQRAWKIAGDKSPIPYNAALISDEAVTDYEINLTKELAKQYGWET